MSQGTSFKWCARKIGENVYELPMTGDMRVPVTAYLSDDLYAASEESVWSQGANAASYEGVTEVHLMPDTHFGYGVPVGSVVVTDSTLIQASVGYDINCGMLLMRVPGIGAGAVKGKYIRERWMRAVEKRVALGIGSNRVELMPQFKRDKVEEILRYGAKALGVPSDRCERQYIPVPENINLARITMAYQKAIPQLGSLGGGNHFIEMQCDEADGSVWVMIHTGSRGYGWQTADFYFHQGAALREMSRNRRENSWLKIDEALGEEFWAHHNSAANYAIANRHIIAMGIREALQEVFDVDGEVFYEISHNLVQKETLVSPDGSTRQAYVHRKGATRAMPAGHPDLVGTSWSDTGHPCLIPGSMYSGAAVLCPAAGAHKTACSVNHGSGRLLGRGDAKRKLGRLQDEIDNTMRTVIRECGGVPIEGIVTNNKHVPIDECGNVYKDLDAVLAVLVAEGIATISRRLVPVVNIKGSDKGPRERRKGTSGDWVDAEETD